MNRPLGVILLAAFLALPGCIQRRIRVTSEPAGARVWLNDVEIGRTPAEAEFTFYGAYDVRLEKEGYEPIHAKRRTHAPFYEYPGPDLIAAALPTRLEKVFEWHFDLERSLESQLPPEQLETDLVDRARRMRRETEQQPPTENSAPAPASGSSPDSSNTSDSPQ